MSVMPLNILSPTAAHCYWSNSVNCHDKFHSFTLEGKESNCNFKQ